MSYDPSANKIDNAATLGLLGANNSLAYRAHEIESHFHGRERWYGLAAADVVIPYTVISDAAANTYGTEVLLLDTGDTPKMNALGTANPNVKFDLHNILFSSISVDAKIHKFRIAWGTGTHAQAITNSQFTTIMLYSDASTGSSNSGATSIMIPRISAGTKVWISSKDNHTSAITTSLFIGLHEYEG